MNTACYVIDGCVIPHFGNSLNHAAHLISYLYDILNLAKSDTFSGPLRVRFIES